MFKNFLIRLVLITFVITSLGPLPNVFAQTMMDLPAPGIMVNFSPKFNQATLKGIVFHPENPFKFDFILDEGDTYLNDQESKAQSQKIAAYFLASLTTPEKEIWVNLSPFEKSRIIPTSFGNTLMGQNLLAQDYMLKQIMATALYPERQMGREFWKKVYTQALIKFGTTNIPINTFNKVWIVPDKAVVYENTKMNAVFVAESSLKVMLEKDYLAEKKNKLGIKSVPILESVSSTMSAAVIKELVIPALEKEVNEGKNFAPLRQVYNSLILAKWYKDNLRDNVIAKGYVNRNKIKGVESHDKQRVSQIYRQYLKAYRKGVFNYIKEDFDEVSQSTVPRKYFSGGFIGEPTVTYTRNRAMAVKGLKRALIASVLLTVAASSIIPPASAQEQQARQQATEQTIQQTVSQAIGIQTETPPDITDPNLKKQLLDDIKKATSNGKGDPVSAGLALRRIPDTSAAEYAASIMRQHAIPGSFWDKLIQLPSNSTGGVTPSVLTTAQGVVGIGVNVGGKIAEGTNVGDTSLRLEAARYLYRIAFDESRGLKPSGFWQKLFKRGDWESLNTKNESSDTVKAAKLLTQAVFIKLGLESRTLGGTAIAGLEQVEIELQSPNRTVSHSALTVLEAIKLNDPDNRYQGMIERFLRQPTTDIALYERAVRLALKHSMQTALPNIIQNLQNFASTRPLISDPVALTNWHAYIERVKQLAIKLANGNKVLFLANISIMTGPQTASGSTEMVNSFYLGFLFTAKQAGLLTLEDFVKELNKFRERNGLDKVVSLTEYDITPWVHDVGGYLAELKKGINVDQNVLNIIRQGGPDYFSLDLLGIFEETNNVSVAKAILNHLDKIYGVYPIINPWTVAISAKFDHPNLTMHRAIIDYVVQTGGPGDILSRVFAEANNRADKINILKNAANAKVPATDLIPAFIQFLFTQKNPILDTTETGQTQAFHEVVGLVAQAVVHANIGQGDLDALISGNASSGETDMLTRQSLEKAIDTIKTVKDPGAALERASHPDWILAERLFRGYMDGTDGDTSARVAAALEEASQTIKNPSDPRSGYAITESILKEYSNDSDGLIKLSRVFIKFKDRNRGFKLLGRLLDPRFPQVVENVLNLFQQANKDQRGASASPIIDAYLYVSDHRDITNPGRDTRIAGLVSKLGDALAPEINARKRVVTGQQWRALSALGIRLNGVPAAPNSQSAGTGTRTVQSAGSGQVSVLSVPSAGNYEGALSYIQNPNTGGDALLGVLNGMAMPGMRFRFSALDDLNTVLQMPKFQRNLKYRSALQLVIAAAEEQLSGGVVAGNTYQDNYLKEFQDAPDVDTKVTALTLFKKARPEITAELLSDGVNTLEQSYPKLDSDDQQKDDYFVVLTAMRDLIRGFKKTEPDKYQATVGLMLGNLEAQIRTKRFENDKNGTLYLFLKSIDKDTNDKVSKIDLGIESVPETGLTKVPDQPYFVGQTISSYKGILAGILTRANDEIADYESKKENKNKDPLELLEDLYTFSKPIGQMSARHKLGKLALLFPNSPSRYAKVNTHKLYHALQFRIQSDNLPILPDKQTPETLSRTDRMIYERILPKRGKNGMTQALEDLRDEDLYAHSPEAADGLVEELGLQGGPSEVDPLLRFFVDRNLAAWGAFGVGVRVNSTEGTVIKAIINIGIRNGNSEIVKTTIDDFVLPKSFNNGFRIRPIFDGIKQEIDKQKTTKKDKAMANITNGGIDLENVNVQSRETGNVKTVFDDPAQLAILLRSEGLIPVIENVKPLTQFVIDQLLGAI